jgi:polyhydroxyalkanoate synthesis regulator protein
MYHEVCTQLWKIIVFLRQLIMFYGDVEINITAQECLM